MSKFEPPFGGSGYGTCALAYRPRELNLSIIPVGLDLTNMGHIFDPNMLCLWTRSHTLWVLKDIIRTFYSPRNLWPEKGLMTLRGSIDNAWMASWSLANHCVSDMLG